MGFLASYDAAADRWPAGHTARDVPTSWGPTHVLAAGPDTAPTVVLLHGDGATATAWAGVAAGLARHFRVLAPDQPGNPGRSRSSRPFTSTADLVAWLDELLGTVSREPVHLAGHSSGAHLALSCALGREERLRSLSLLDPTFCFAGLSPGYLVRSLPTLLRPTRARVRRFLDWETRGRALEPAWVEAYLQGATDFDRTPIVATRRPPADRLAAMTVPTLVVVAGNGRAHSPKRVARSARAALRSATVVELPGATHHTMPVLDARELAAAMAAHVDGAARS